MNDEIEFGVEESGKADCCLNNCLKNISEEIKLKIRSDFNLCQNYESSSSFIIACVQEEPLPCDKKRKYQNIYRIAGKKVCLKSFCKILDISTKKVSLALKKRREGNLDSVFLSFSNRFWIS